MIAVRRNVIFPAGVTPYVAPWLLPGIAVLIFLIEFGILAAALRQKKKWRLAFVVLFANILSSVVGAMALGNLPDALPRGEALYGFRAMRDAEFVAVARAATALAAGLSAVLEYGAYVIFPFLRKEAKLFCWVLLANAASYVPIFFFFVFS